MKKFIVILAALLVLSVSICACGGGDEDESTSDKGSILGTGTFDSTENESESESESQSQIVDIPVVDRTFTTVDETVYVISYNGAANIRSDTTLSGDSIVDSLSSGTELKRTGVSSDGQWSRVKYNNQTCYIVSTYVTKWATADDVEGFDAVDPAKTLYVKDGNSVNVRPRPNADNEAIATLTGGATINIIGQKVTTDSLGNVSGWYKITRTIKNNAGDDVQITAFITANSALYTTEAPAAE